MKKKPTAARKRVPIPNVEALGALLDAAAKRANLAEQNRDAAMEQARIAKEQLDGERRLCDRRLREERHYRDGAVMALRCVVRDLFTDLERAAHRRGEDAEARRHSEARS